MNQQAVDTRTVRRQLLATCVVAGPALIGVVRATYPAFTSQNASSTVTAFAHHLGSARVELAAGLAATLITPFFVLGVYRLTVRKAPLLATAGAVIGGLGWLMTSFLIAADALAYELARHSGSAVVYHQFETNAAIAGGTVIFIVGHEFGTLLLGAALWRSRTVPAWSAAGFMVAPVVHFMAVMASARWLDIAALAGLTITAAVAASAILRTPNREWDLPPDEAGRMTPAAVVESVAAGQR